jgi:hypothetical protein
MYKSFAESAVLIALKVLSIKWNSHRYPQCRFASSASTAFDSQGSIVGQPALATIPINMYKSFAESAVLIGLMALSIEYNSHRQFASAARPPFDSQVCIVGAPAFSKMVFYIDESIAESALLIGLMLLSFEWNSHRDPSTASGTSIPKDASSGHRGWPE